MHTSPIQMIRNAGAFVRSIAAIVVVTFSMLILTPTAMAAKETYKDQKQQQAYAPDDEAKLSRALQKIDELLKKVDDKLTQGKDTSIEEDELKKLKKQIEKLDEKVSKNFEKMEAHLKEKGMSEVILQRHYDMVKNYRLEMKTMMQNLDDIEVSEDEEAKKKIVKKAHEHMKGKKHKRGHQPLDPNNLPFRVRDGKVRKPKKSKKEYEASLFPRKNIQVASNVLTPSMLATAMVSAAPTPADVAPTEEVQITQEIIDLAASLDNSPVKIYNWVHNNIEFLPTYGSIQGSQMTLETKRGNAFDTSSLLIALLRAAKIPSRYVYGTIEIPIEKVMNWVGGVDVPGAAFQLLGQGGIPHTGITSGGKIIAVQMEHVWVDAWVDYVPSRGAVNRVGDSWIPMDGAFKSYDLIKNDVVGGLNYSSKELIELTKSGSVYDVQLGKITSIDTSTLYNGFSEYQGALNTFISYNSIDKTLLSVLGGSSILSKNTLYIPSSLPYKIVVIGNHFSEMPQFYRHQISIKLYASANDRRNGAYLFAINKNIPDVSAKKIVLSYEPSSPEEKKIIDDAYERGDVTFPAYLVNVIPSLKIEGTIEAITGARAIGENHVFEIEIITPWYKHSKAYDVVSGGVLSLGVNPAGINHTVYNKRLLNKDLTDGKDEDFIGELYHQVLLGFWAEEDVSSSILSNRNDVIQYRLPSHGVAGSPISVSYFFGLPRNAGFNSRMLDVKESIQTAVHTENNSIYRNNYFLALGIIGSYLEASIYDQIFLAESSYSISAVTAIGKAIESGIPIYRITQSNVSMILPSLSLHPDDISDIKNAVNQGFIVYAPESEISSFNYVGTGLIIIDPQTGAGSYLISGGRDGNDTPAPESVYPLPQLPANGAQAFIIGSAARNADADIVIENGMIVGIALASEVLAAESTIVVGGGTAAAGGSALGPIAVLLLIVLSLNAARVQSIESQYPQINQIYRHYTNTLFAGAIWTSKTIFASDDTADFGAGVYTVSPPDGDIDCPLSIQDSFIVAGRYNIVGNTPNAYVEFVITRAGYWDKVIDEEINNNGKVETIFRLPLVYFGPFSVGMDGYDVCF